MINEEITLINKRFPALSNANKLIFLRQNNENNTQFSIVNDEIIEMPIYSKKKHNIIKYLHSVLNDGKNKVEIFSQIYFIDDDNITFDLAVNFNSPSEHRIFTCADAYLIVAISENEREFYLKIFNKLRKFGNSFNYCFIDVSAKTIINFKSNYSVSDVSFEMHHKSDNFFKLKEYEFDMKKIFY
ncbi:MAG: hypothetical protein DCC88_00070 [Spirobacillus cienkowskii]|uniref:Uncharacterized protein n=1 Tax=Spirobacillus cienkowskii TaxID=495820 RepID=A0A369KXB3_9BACT|nr:MAG: hypothetical protein DCC88_00070 [Spirobacillus cienkowskii]